MYEGNDSKEGLAQELKLKSEEFFANDVTGRRALLKGFLHWIDENVDDKVLSLCVDSEFQSLFEESAERAFNTPQISLDKLKDKNIEYDELSLINEDLVFPFQEGYTVVAMNSKGVPIGYVYKPIGKLGDFNTAKTAYQKAVLLKFLEDEGKSDGLCGRGNMEIARKYGYGGHWGSALKSVVIPRIGKVYVGASGVGQNQGYNSTLSDGAKPDEFSNSGLFDASFASIVSLIVEAPDVPDFPRMEHDLFVENKDRN